MALGPGGLLILSTLCLLVLRQVIAESQLSKEVMKVYTALQVIIMTFQQKEMKTKGQCKVKSVRTETEFSGCREMRESMLQETSPECPILGGEWRRPEHSRKPTWLTVSMLAV